jgi:hypothetical protein
MKKQFLRIKKSRAGFAAFMLIFLFMSNLSLRAQVPYADQSILNVSTNNDSPVKSIKNFSASTYNNIVYLNLIMKGETENSVFLLERSVNNFDFTVIGKKSGYTSPNRATEMLYSFKDENPIPGTAYYRIKQFRNDGILYSQTLSVYSKEEIPIVQNQKDQ